MRELKKQYLVEVERRENPEAAKANDAITAQANQEAAAAAAQATKVAAAAVTTSAAAGGTADRVDGVTTAAEGGGAEEGAGDRKKRKKRWGDVRKNRFANKEEDAAGGDAEVAPPANKRKSRCESSCVPVVSTAVVLAL